MTCQMTPSPHRVDHGAACSPALTDPDYAPRRLDRAAALAYVLGRQTASAGFCFYRTPSWGVDEPNAPDTLAALESLRLLGHDPPTPDQTVQWLRSLQDCSGSFPTLLIGWSALRSLRLLNAEPASSWRDWLADMLLRILNGPPAREWPIVLRELLELMELLALGTVRLSRQQQRALADLVEAARMPGSGWTRAGVELESTACAVRLLKLAGVSLGERRAVERVVRGCEDRALGLRIAPEAGATSAASLDAGLELCQMLGIQPSYPDAIASSIALLQRTDGGLGARHRAISTLHDTLLGLRAEQLLLNLRETQP